jgi:hypothetical protein
MTNMTLHVLSHKIATAIYNLKHDRSNLQIAQAKEKSSWMRVYFSVVLFKEILLIDLQVT